MPGVKSLNHGLAVSPHATEQWFELVGSRREESSRCARGLPAWEAAQWVQPAVW